MMMAHTIEDFDDTVAKHPHMMFDPALDQSMPVATNADDAMNTAQEKRTSRLVSTPQHEDEPDERQGAYSALPNLGMPSSSWDEEAITGRYSNIEYSYQIDPRVLGTGHHGSVRQCIHRATGKRCAVKSIRKTEPTVKPAGLVREISLLEEMKHANIIELIDTFEDLEYVHLVTDICEGGELFDRIVERSSANNGVPCFPEQEAARIIRQVLASVEFMHKKGCAHRDVKPENILFETSEVDSQVKIIDFGLSRKHLPHQGPMSTIVGTPYYVAPEVLRKRYDKSCDLWSVGVITYILLCGYPPFNGGNTDQTHKSVLRGRYCFPAEDWKDISHEAMDFIHKLLQMDPRRRMTAAQALNHPWIVKHTWTHAYAMTSDQDSVRDNSSVEVLYHEPPPKVSREARGLSPVRRELCMPAYEPSPMCMAAYEQSPRKPMRKCGESPPRRKLRMSTFGL